MNYRSVNMLLFQFFCQRKSIMWCRKRRTREKCESFNLSIFSLQKFFVHFDIFVLYFEFNNYRQYFIHYIIMNIILSHVKLFKLNLMKFNVLKFVKWQKGVIIMYISSFSLLNFHQMRMSKQLLFVMDRKVKFRAVIFN